MKFPLKTLAAAMFACGTCTVGLAAAVSLTPAERSETRETRAVIIESDLATGAAGATGIVIAQSEPGTQRKEVKVITSGSHAGMHELPDIDAIVSHAMAEAFSGTALMSTNRVVKNAPYSAEVISEKIQLLPDGNQIAHRTSSTAARDAAGRTRQEKRDANGEVKSIHIHDAVEGTRYVLNPAKKSATKLAFDKDLHKRIEAIKEKAKAMAKDGKAHIIEHGKPGEEIIVKRVEAPAADGRKEIKEEVNVKVVRLGGVARTPGDAASVVHLHGDNAQAHVMALSDGASATGMLAGAFQDGKWASKSTTSALGTKEIDGVRVEGKRVSYTIPAGEIGNRNPITVSTETWISPELQVTVYSKRSDPRTGDTIYRLANIKRSEPPATLFMVPDGFTVKESAAFDWKFTK